MIDVCEEFSLCLHALASIAVVKGGVEVFWESPTRSAHPLDTDACS